MAVLLVMMLSCPAVASSVTFPGPAPILGLGNATCGVGVPWLEGGAEYLVIGNDTGFLNLVRLLSGADNFNILTRYYVGGTLNWVDTWENPAEGTYGVVVACMNPDRVIFFRIEQTAPFLFAMHEVDLPEDPGTFAFVGPDWPGGQELAVSLPGVDQIAILKSDIESGSWSVSQVLDAGDRPQFLVGLDLEDDGVREVVSADEGALSGNLGLFRRDSEGNYSRTGQQTVAGWPTALRTYDIDGDHKQELVVALADVAEILFMEGEGGQLVASSSVGLTIPAENIYLCPWIGGGIGLFSSVRERGFLECISGHAGNWVLEESYYPGCQPVGITSSDLNGDGVEDLVCLGSNALPTSVLLGKSDATFWGYPAFVLKTDPGSSALADFDLDGHSDLVLVGWGSPLLSVFLGQAEGRLKPASLDQEFGYLMGGLVAIESGGSAGPELALLDLESGLLRIMDYDPSAGFQPLTSLPLLSLPRQMHAEDLDNDGNMDLFMARSSTKDVLVLFGDGAGNFSREAVLALPTGSVEVIAIPLNSDSFPDLVAVDGVSRAYTFLNQGDGTFAAGTSVQAGIGARYLVPGDLDGDLDLDVVVGNRTGATLNFLENQLGGSLVRRAETLNIGGTLQSISCGDFDQSGTLDILVNLGVGGLFGVVFGLGDWNFSILLEFAGGVGLGSTMVGDFNLDGIPDVRNLDQSLLLGLTMLNIDRNLVSVDPAALSFTCDNRLLAVTVLPDRPGPWDLEVGSPGGWISLVQAGQSTMGNLDFDGRKWFVEVAWEDLALANPGAEVYVRLGTGQGPNREYLSLAIDTECRPLGVSGGSPILDWEQEPWPNPFNPSVSSRIFLTRSAQVTAGIYDLAGHRVATLLQGTLDAGGHTVTWDGAADDRPASAGVYFLRINGPGIVLSRKVLLLK